MQNTKAVRILITIPQALKQYLDALRHLESVTVSGYIQHLLREDRQARMETGWRLKDGWDNPAAKRYRARTHPPVQAGVNRVVEELILKAAQRIERKKAVLKAVR